MDQYMRTVTKLSKKPEIKSLAKLILDKNDIIIDLINKNDFAKLDAIEYKQYFINKMNSKISEQFSNNENIPLKIKEIYFKENIKNFDQLSYAQTKIQSLIDEIAYPSVYDYRNKNKNTIETLAIQYNNEYGNPELTIPTFALEREIKKYRWTIQKSSIKFPHKIEIFQEFLSILEIDDLYKRILFTVTGGKGNIDNITKINDYEWNFLVKNPQLINLKPYIFFHRYEESRFWRQLSNAPIKSISHPNQDNIVQIKLNLKNDVAINEEFIKKIKDDLEKHWESLKKPEQIKYLVVDQIVHKFYLEIIAEHKKAIENLKKINSFIEDKKTLKEKMYNTIKKNLSNFNKSKNWCGGSGREQRTNIEQLIEKILVIIKSNTNELAIPNPLNIKPSTSKE